jgi:hypothetical protein
VFNRLQRNFFIENIKIRREQQIEDFIVLNEFKKVKFITDTDVLTDIQDRLNSTSAKFDLIVITDQKFSRYPCPVLIEKIKWYLTDCANLYLCLNRHYINIDNSYHDYTLDSNFNLAITQWLKKNLVDITIVDMSLDYVEYGQAFTWVIPDRHYFITRHD